MHLKICVKKTWSLQKVLFKRALKFEKLGRLLKAKRVYIQHIAFGLKIFCMYTNAKYLLI